MDNDDVISISNITTTNMNDSIFTTTVDDQIYAEGGSYTITLDSSYDSTHTFDTSINLDDLNITWNPVEFEDEMPSVAKVEDMCVEYPALKVAYEKFKTVYQLVEQDWLGKQEED